MELPFRVAFLVFILFAQTTNQLRQAGYWGQGVIPTEKSLRHYCDTNNYDIIVIGFVSEFGSGRNTTINLSGHCWNNGSNPTESPGCQTEASDIEYCQRKGKIIMLSMGGAAGNYEFTNDSNAEATAQDVWDKFLGGTADFRPFGNVTFDGIDLDMKLQKSRTNTGYTAFAKKLRSLCTGECYLSASPKSDYPDDAFGPGNGTVLDSVRFDFIGVQFINGASSGTFNTSLEFWTNYTRSFNTSLFVGVPAADVKNFGEGYTEALTLINALRTAYNTYGRLIGGTMLFDTSAEEINRDYASTVKRCLTQSDGKFPETKECGNDSNLIVTGTKNDSNSIVIGISVALSAAVIIAVVAISIFYILRRRQAQLPVEVKESTKDVVNYSQPMQSAGGDYVLTPQSQLVLKFRSLSRKIEAQDMMLTDIIIKQKLGEGNFGEVFYGEWRGTPVALKRLDESEFHEFEKEAQMLSSLTHPNVIRFLGLYIEYGSDADADRHFIATEYAKGGSLEHYLRTVGRKLNMADKIGFMFDVAKGMVYLSSRNVVHRDLACRNLLLNKGMEAVISDFGMSRYGEYQALASAKIPFKITAIEVLEQEKATSQSDVWSFGVVCWEILTNGALPFSGYSVLILYERLKRGERLPRPEECCDELWIMMQKCWMEDPKQRPDFNEILGLLQRMMKGRDRSNRNLMQQYRTETQPAKGRRSYAL